MLRLGDSFSRPWPAPPSQRSPATDAALRRTRERAGRTASAVRPPAAVAATYRTRLLRLIAEMDNSVCYWTSARFRQTEDQREHLRMAMDATAADDLQGALRNLRRRWSRRFAALADDLAAYFAKASRDRTDAELKRILKRSGLSVDFKPTRTMREALDAIVAENVSLIRSIPEQYLGRVEGAVMRSVLEGRDLAGLTADIRQIYGVTRRRAELIARDQNNKASAALQRVRYGELGIERATWRHSRAGREPRPSHVANDGNEFDVREGWLDPAIGKRIWPGTEINCRCVAIPVMPS